MSIARDLMPHRERKRFLVSIALQYTQLVLNLSSNDMYHGHTPNARINTTDQSHHTPLPSMS